jgi:hypothetical protein
VDYLGCRVCENPVLVLTAGHDGQSHYRWRLTCGNGHEWVAIPGNVLTITVPTEVPEFDCLDD